MVQWWLMMSNGTVPSPVVHQQPRADHCLSFQILHVHMVQHRGAIHVKIWAWSSMENNFLSYPFASVEHHELLRNSPLQNPKIVGADSLVQKVACTTPALLHLIPIRKTRCHFSPSLGLGTCQLGTAKLRAKFPFQAAWPEPMETRNIFLFLRMHVIHCNCMHASTNEYIPTAFIKSNPHLFAPPIFFSALAANSSSLHHFRSVGP